MTKLALRWKIKEEAMLTRCLTLIGLVAALSICSGCGKTITTKKETMLERNWGRSFESMKYNQILNPEAGKNLDPVVGLDGQSAEKNMDKYKKSFEKEPPQKAYNINLGGISAIGQE